MSQEDAFTNYYRAMSDSELIILAANSASLVPVAQRVLSKEIECRKLAVAVVLGPDPIRSDPIRNTTKLTFNRLIRIVWFLTWRSFLLGLVVNKYTGAALPIIFGKALGLTILAALIVGYLWAWKKFLDQLLREDFRDFRVQLVRSDDKPNNEMSWQDTLRIAVVPWAETNS